MTARALAGVSLLGVLAGCPKASPDAVDAPAAPPSATPATSAAAGALSCAAAQAEADRLHTAAMAIVVRRGCADARDCAASPIGAKPCGGPEGYVPYCAKTTDVASLRVALAAHERASRAVNEACHLASDCAVVSAPAVILKDGQCAANGAAIEPLF